MAKPKQSNKKAPKKPEKSNGNNTAFADLKKRITEAEDRITSAMDKLLLKGGSFAELLEQIGKENERLGSKDFKTPSRIKAHIKFREQKGWVFTYKDDTVKLTGFEKRL